MRSQKWLLILVFGVALIYAHPAVAQPDPMKTAAALAQEKLAIVRKIYEQMWQDRKWNDAETPHLWSCRLLEAELAVSTTKENRNAAYRAHMNRMRELNVSTARLRKLNLIGSEQADMTQFFVAEAELWVVQAKQ